MKDLIFSYAGLVAILGVLSAIVKFVGLPLFKAKFTLEQIGRIQYWVNFFVLFIENIFNEPKQGPKKKRWVKEKIMKMFNLSDEELNNLIEKAVEDMNNQ